MVKVVSDLAETVLGPWGVAVAVGVGIVAALRRGGGSTVETPEPASPVVVPPASPVAAAGSALVGRVRAGVGRATASVSDYWTDLYAEAHHEWEQARVERLTRVGAGAAGTTGPARPAALPAVVTATTAAAAEPAARRVRGPNGRYVKATI